MSPHFAKPSAVSIVDLGYGDAGKGSMTDYLAAVHGSDLVIRFNGGAQSGHNVVTPGGRWHTFSQMGSSTFLPGTRTLLTRRVVFHPFALSAEIENLDALGVHNAMGRLFVDGRALVTTPYHQAWNRLRETARGDARHGSCGAGLGETVRESIEFPNGVIRVADLCDTPWVERALNVSRERALEWIEHQDPAELSSESSLEDIALLKASELVGAVVEAFCVMGRRLNILDERGVARLVHGARVPIFEGAQGVLLDQDYGFHPHTTFSKTDGTNVDEVLEEIGWARPIERVGVLRTHVCRHGAGPLVTEDESVGELVDEPHNKPGDWQGAVRYGWFDAVATAYALAASRRIDSLALTHMDTLRKREWTKVAVEWTLPEEPQKSYTPEVRAGTPHDELTRAQVTCDTVLDERTERVSRARPHYAEVRVDEFVPFVEARFDLPVRWTSAGPTRSDKRAYRGAR